MDDYRPTFRFFDALRPLGIVEIPLETKAAVEAFKKVTDLDQLEDFLAGLNDGEFHDQLVP